MVKEQQTRLSLDDVRLNFDAKYTREDMLFRLDALNTFPEIANNPAAQSCLNKIRDVAEPAAADDIIHFELDEETEILYPIATSSFSVNL